MPPAPQPQDARSDSAGIDLNDFPDIIDASVFEQILEMDDDPQDREFSRDIVINFFEQAKATLEEMDELSKHEKLHELSEKGHFLKGSSATLGLTKMQKSCEKIQNFGKRQDAKGEKAEPDAKKSLQNCISSIEDAKVEYHEAQELLTKFYRLE